jgi:uncharacterized protein (DUF362 family)
MVSDEDRPVQREAAHDPAPAARRGPPAIDRRHFVATVGIAAVGLTAGCARIPRPPASDASVTGEPTRSTEPSAAAAPAGWKAVAALSTVAVAADPAARGYPAPTLGPAFDHHPAIVLLERALTRLSGRPPAEYLRSLVPEGGTILIKPNWVEAASWADGKITHPALVLAMARIASEALGPGGRVLVAEGTSEGPDLAAILRATGFATAVAALNAGAAAADRAPVRIVDLNGLASGVLRVGLGNLSRFASVHGELFDPANRSMGEMGDGHVGAYLLARPVASADLVVDMAKAKVHCSAGTTLALKNLLGIAPSGDGTAGDRHLKLVPHYSADDKASGRQYVLNRTIGVAAADLCALASYVAKDGSVQRRQQRKLLCVIDGVVSGEHSQMKPTPVSSGWIAAGLDPVAVDHVATRCMGFDPARVESLKAATRGTLGLGRSAPQDVRVVYDGPGSFSTCFTRERRLESERVVADWGGSIDLGAFDLKVDRVATEGDRLTVVSTGDHPAARLEGDGFFKAVARRADGAFTADLPHPRPGGLRLVVMDEHFNVAERALG